MKRIRIETWATLILGIGAILAGWRNEVALQLVMGGTLVGAGLCRAVDAIRGVGQDVYDNDRKQFDAKSSQ